MRTLSRDEYPPSVELARLYQKTSARGLVYYVGRLGKARITILPAEDADDGTPMVRLMVQQPPDPQTAAAPRPPRQNTLPLPRQQMGLRVKEARSSAVTPSGPLADDPIDDLWPEGER